MKSGKTPAVVIEVRSYGESDKIVTFYSKNRGRMSGIAKGAQRSLKRFVNKLELFSHLEILYTEGRSSSLVRIDQAELLNPRPLIRNNYDRYTAATLICELILLWTREDDPDDQIYTLLNWTLLNLDNPDRSTAWLIILFNIKLLTLLGYQPNLAGCSECDTLAPNHGPYRLTPAMNGLLCSRCAGSTTTTPRPPGPLFSLGTARILHRAQEMPLEMVNRLHFSPSVVEEALAMLKNYSSTILQRDVSSWDFLVK